MAPTVQPVIVRVPHIITGEWPPALRRRQKDLFIVTAEFLPLGAGLTATVAVNIEAESDFVIQSAQGLVTSDDNLTLVGFPPILCDLRDTGSGRTFSDAPVPFVSMFGTAQAPAYWWQMGWAKRLRQSSTLMVTLQNLDVANDRNVRLAFWGAKVFRVEEQPTDE